MTCKEEDIVKVCRLCLNIIHDIIDVNPVENYISQMLEELFIKVNLSISSDPIICSECAAYLQEFFDFQWKCLSTLEDTKEHCTLSLNENENIDINDVSIERKICRFCSNITQQEFTQLHDTKENIFVILFLQEHIPSLNLNVTEGKELIACRFCFDSLKRFHAFIETCTDVEEIIKKHAGEGLDENGYIKLSKVAENTFNGPTVREKNIYHEYDDEDSKWIEIKTENIFKEQVDMRINSEEKHWDTELKFDDSNTAATPIYRCRKCSLETSYRCNHSCDSLNRESVSGVKMHVCVVCPYKTKFQFLLKRHLSYHKRSPEIQIFSCHLCTYTAHISENLLQHLGSHERPAEFNKYKCNLCSYESKSRGALKTHMVIHQNPQTKMYECGFCSYAAKHKIHLNRHMLVHKNPSEVIMYKCAECTFETKYERCLRRHSIIHKPRAEVTMYKCNFCSYEVKRESNLKRHMLNHKSLSEVILLHCEKCAYQTKHKEDLMRHMKVHNETVAAPSFKCDLCPYAAAKFRYLKRHMINHKSLSEITMLECKKCSYKTKHKDNLRAHMIIHKDPSELKIYKCFKCAYETRYKRSLERHVLTHR